MLLHHKHFGHASRLAGDGCSVFSIGVSPVTADDRKMARRMEVTAAGGRRRYLVAVAMKE
jgi:hypothetical protein